MRLLCTVLLVILIPLTLHAAITVTYDPEPVLFFEPGTSPLSTQKLVAKLGTVTFRGDPLRHPTLIATTMTHEFQFTGPISSGSGGYTTAGSLFYLYAVSTNHQGTKTAKILNDPNGNHALQTKGGNVNVDPFIVHLYLVSHLDVSQFKLGSNYTLSGGTLGGFQIGVANTGSGYHPGTDPLVPVEGWPEGTPTPILPPGSSPNDPIIYGDPPDTVICTFAIINEQPFELDQAYNNKTAVVATAQINLSNVASGQTYGVTLTFTNASDTPPFLMTLQETMENPPTIEYKLKFNDVELDHGESADWEDLGNGTSSKHIYVTGISSSIEQTYLSGSYSDTVYVNITPIESQ